MKKKLLIVLFVCGLIYSGSAYKDLYGAYKKTGPNSFVCMMISTKLCARVQEPPPQNPWPTFIAAPQNGSITIYNESGGVRETFSVKACNINVNSDGSTVTYELP